MIIRKNYLKQLDTAIQRAPITAILGPRQCGKTTLVREYLAEKKSTYFDLESPADKQALENPFFVLGSLDGIVVIDEIQHMPSLFNALRVIVDEPKCKARFIILGSASFSLIRESADSLAGRLTYLDMEGFDLSEITEDDWKALWIRGGFPRSYLAANDQNSMTWREDYIRTVLARDIPQLGYQIPEPSLRRFWNMLANYHGQTWNGSEIGAAMGMSHLTVRNYLDLLTSTYMVRQLQPWYANIQKRQVKSPKVYIRDSGLLHAFLKIADMQQLVTNPVAGASWEGFVIDQVSRKIEKTDLYFWATHNRAELDLFWYRGSKNFGIEIKFNEAPRLTPSMRVAVEDLNLEHLWVVTPGMKGYKLAERVSVLPLAEIDQIKM